MGDFGWSSGSSSSCEHIHANIMSLISGELAHQEERTELGGTPEVKSTWISEESDPGGLGKERTKLENDCFCRVLHYELFWHWVVQEIVIVIKIVIVIRNLFYTVIRNIKSKRPLTRWFIAYLDHDFWRSFHVDLHTAASESLDNDTDTHPTQRWDKIKCANYRKWACWSIAVRRRLCQTNEFVTFNAPFNNGSLRLDTAGTYPPFFKCPLAKGGRLSKPVNVSF
jgi:hypothetical protein